MANFTIEKTVLVKGETGETGDRGTDTTVPENGIIYYEGDEPPTGYVSLSD